MAKEPEKKYYTVEVEALVPTIIKYRVLAESAEKAVDLISSSPLLESPKQKLSAAKRIKAKVYDLETVMLRYTKTF